MIGAIASIAPALFGLMDNLFTSDEERAEAKRKLVEMEQAGELEKVKGQLAINMQEAKHESIFVAGWRRRSAGCAARRWPTLTSSSPSRRSPPSSEASTRPPSRRCRPSTWPS